MSNKINTTGKDKSEDKNLLTNFNNSVKDNVKEVLDNIQMELELMGRTYRSQQNDMQATLAILRSRL